MRFSLRELSGSLGDLGTFLPLAAAMAAVNRLDLGVVFLFAGMMNIATGVLFRQPIPVQPMKAIAAVAIAEGLSPGAIAASGMAIGVIVTLLAVVGAVNWIDRVVPRPVIRGIQAGVGAKLALKGITWTTGLPLLGPDSALVAVAAGLAVALIVSRRIPIILILFLAGLAVAAWSVRDDLAAASWTPPTLAVVIPSSHEWLSGLTRGAVPQLPLTLLNSVLAVCALSGDLFPGRAIPPRRMALSVGVMNLLTTPFGAMPMCHGAGGLAAQHRFGARTGGSVVMLGIGKIAFALALGGMLLPIVHAYPRSLLAVMIFFAGVTLMKPAHESLRDPRAAAVMLATASVILLAGTLEGFLAGCAIAGAIALVMPRRERSAPRTRPSNSKPDP
jgi:MFS superfamily sulfate permease-like transporter